MNVIVYVRQGAEDSEPELYACGRCGAVQNPRLFAAPPDRCHEAARAAAEKCKNCAPITPEIDRAARDEQRRRSIENATEVANLVECFSDDGGEFYTSIEDARDAGETGVFGAEFKPFHLDADHVVENILEDHHDQASIAELVDLDPLTKAIDDFNAAQTSGSYFPDHKKWQRIHHNLTFAMIKPDATRRGIENDMLADIAAAGFNILAQRREFLAREQAEWLYDEHKQKDHFKDLVDFTCSGEVVLLLLHADHENTPAKFRSLMGPTDQSKAEPHTLRAKYAIGLRENSIHGSDGPAAAISEVAYFFFSTLLELNL